MQLPAAIRRVAYRCAYIVLRVYWFAVRPRSRGVKCVITDGGLVLLVRHTYGPRVWDLPGGVIKRREEPLDAARREVREELGVCLERWSSLGQMSVRIDYRRDTIHCFHAEVHRPEIVLDLGELSAVRWFPRERLPEKQGRNVREILARAQ